MQAEFPKIYCSLSEMPKFWINLIEFSLIFLKTLFYEFLRKLQALQFQKLQEFIFKYQ